MSENQVEPKKKGFWADLMGKIDQKIAGAACSGGCCCSGDDKKEDKKTCC